MNQPQNSFQDASHSHLRHRECGQQGHWWPTIHSFDFQSRGRGQVVRLMLIVRLIIQFSIVSWLTLQRTLAEYTKIFVIPSKNGQRTNAAAHSPRWTPLVTSQSSKCPTARSLPRATPFSDSGADNWGCMMERRTMRNIGLTPSTILSLIVRLPSYLCAEARSDWDHRVNTLHRGILL